MQAAEPAPLEPGRETVDSVVSDSQQETLEPPADAGLEDCALETYEIEVCAPTCCVLEAACV